MFDSLLEQNPRIQEIRSSALAEGEAKGIAEGKIEGKLETSRAISIALVQERFPELTETVQRLVMQVEKPAILQQFIVQVATVPNEEAALRLLLMLK